MPTYEYECPDCGHQFEEMQKITDPALTECPQCGASNVRRLVSAAAFHLKGSGWYKTDYAGSNKKDSKKETAESSDSSDKSSDAGGSTSKQSTGESKAESSNTSSNSTDSTSSKE